MPLTQTQAQLRTRCIQQGSITYHFHIHLQKGEIYSGLSEITFTLTQIPPLTLEIDFQGHQILSIIQNGTPTKINTIKGFIQLDTTQLKVGRNLVAVHYSNQYDNDGSGCVSFIDTDQKQYVSTQFAPYYANRVFPCFDQPDLKATMRLSVISPVDWSRVISNEDPFLESQFVIEDYLKASGSEMGSQVEKYLEGREGRMTLFSQSKVLSSYLYCFVAGDYAKLQLPVDERYKNIPMSLYCISSLLPALQAAAPFIFEITIESMKFYQDFFQFPYSFAKYDQIFAHEYKWGAMENAGAVIVNDKYLFAGKVSNDRRLQLAIVLSHQLSHHWFGNLVTMKWWDDLWLNETFATFISYLCLDRIKPKLKTLEFESSMVSFLQAKERGYNQDQMVTTHPIRGPVANTSVADSLFDGITYCKGAAVMKQLFHLVGENDFRLALASYFQKHQWTNATIDHLLQEMQTHFALPHFSLAKWKTDWLETASLNLLEPLWHPESPTLTIKQHAHSPAYPTLRHHKIQVALFLDNSQTDTLDVLVAPQLETKVCLESKGYRAVLLNSEDYSFVKVLVDPVSLEFFRENLPLIRDSLSRGLIWNSFRDMVRDAKIRLDQFVEIVVCSLGQEPSDSILEKVLQEVSAAILLFAPEDHRMELWRRMFEFVYSNLLNLPSAEQNRGMVLKRKIIDFAWAEEHIKLLIDWMLGKEDTLKGINVGGGEQCLITDKAFTLALPREEQERLFSKISGFSDSVTKYRAICDCLVSNEEQFQQTYALFLQQNSKVSVSAKQQIAKGWNHPRHQKRLLAYRDRYFKDVQELAGQLSGDHFHALYTFLAPSDDDLNYQIERFEGLHFPEGCEKHTNDVLKMIDDLRRRQKAYQLYQS